MNKVTAIIQARMQSTRLPGKSMRELAGRPLIAHVMERARAIPSVDTVVLAIPDDRENIVLADLARSMGIEVFAGSLDNVLERYWMAARRFGGDFIVRITGDNPFTDIGCADATVRRAIETGADICAPEKLPLGTAVEVIGREALETAYREGNEPHQKEHVSPFIKEHPARFRIERFPVDLENPFDNLRLTVDTEEDLRLASAIYEALYRGVPLALGEVIRYLAANPRLAEINKAVEQRTMFHSENKDD